jgi:hypothetical protein
MKLVEFNQRKSMFVHLVLMLVLVEEIVENKD